MSTHKANKPPRDQDKIDELDGYGKERRNANKAKEKKKNK